MEDLLREILAPSPTLSPSALPLDSPITTASLLYSEASTPSTVGELDWESEVGMQRLLDMLPNVQSMDVNHSDMVEAVDFPSALDMELGGGWDVENFISSSSSIGVF